MDLEKMTKLLDSRDVDNMSLAFTLLYKELGEKRLRDFLRSFVFTISDIGATLRVLTPNYEFVDEERMFLWKDGNPPHFGATKTLILDE